MLKLFVWNFTNRDIPFGKKKDHEGSNNTAFWFFFFLALWANRPVSRAPKPLVALNFASDQCAELYLYASCFAGQPFQKVYKTQNQLISLHFNSVTFV